MKPSDRNDGFLAAEQEGRLSSCRRTGRPPGPAAFLPPNRRGDFLVAHRDRRLSCRRTGGATFLSPTRTGGFLAAEQGGATFLSPTGTGGFLAAEQEGRLSCAQDRRLSCRRTGGATFLSPTGIGGFLAGLSCRPPGPAAFLTRGGGLSDFLVAHRDRRLSCRRIPKAGWARDDTGGWRQEFNSK